MSTVVVVLVAASLSEFALGLAVGRRLPRRGRHSRPWRPWARRRWDQRAAAREQHPTAQDDNVVIDLRAWIPPDEAYDAAALRTALIGRRSLPT